MTLLIRSSDESDISMKSRNKNHWRNNIETYIKTNCQHWKTEISDIKTEAKQNQAHVINDVSQSFNDVRQIKSVL